MVKRLLWMLLRIKMRTVRVGVDRILMSVFLNGKKVKNCLRLLMSHSIQDSYGPWGERIVNVYIGVFDVI